MYVDLKISRRPSDAENIEDLNARLLGQLVDVSNFWKPGKPTSDAIFEEGEELSSLLLFDVLVDALGAQVRYCARFPAYLSLDKAMADDSFGVTFDTEKGDYVAFCHGTVPRLLALFGAYRATMRTDKPVRLEDHRRLVARYYHGCPDLDGRDTVERIWPLSFFDDILCRRAFGIGAEEVVRRAKPECEHAEFMLDGAFLIVTSDIVTGRPALDALHERVIKRLGATVMA